MKAVEADARRYAWSRSQALWLVGLDVPTFLEDVHGAREAGQDALLRWAARMLGGSCAVALNVALNHDRPVPTQAMRYSWALQRLQGHPLWQPCWELIRGVEDISAAEIVSRCEWLVEEVRVVAGEMPNPLVPEGHLPAMALARDWVKLMDAVGEQPQLPRDWTRPS